MISPEAVSKALSLAEVKAEELAKKVRDTRAEDPEFDTKLELAFGVVLCFFGGQFPTTFAFAEAFSQAGLTGLVEHTKTLAGQVRQANEACKLDDLKDENEDGVADVKQLLTERDLWARKLRVAYGAMDPQVVRSALKALGVCFAAAITTVQLRFARVLSLGVLLGDFVRKHLIEKYCEGAIRQAVSPEFHKWLPLSIELACRVVATWLAYYLTSLLMTVSSSLAGGVLVLKAINQLCANRGVEFLTQGPADEALTLGLVGFGVLGQTMAGTTTKTLFGLVCFPLAVTEFLLKLTVVLTPKSQ